MTPMSRNARRREWRRLRKIERTHENVAAELTRSRDYWARAWQEMRRSRQWVEMERDAISAKLRSLCAVENAMESVAFCREPAAEAYEVPVIGQYQTVRVRL